MNKESSNICTILKYFFLGREILPDEIPPDEILPKTVLFQMRYPNPSYEDEVFRNGCPYVCP